MLEVHLDTAEFKRDARRAFAIHAKAFPDAVRYTLNELAAQTYKAARKDLSKTFTLRNTWTARSLAYEKVGSSDVVETMESRVGSREAYMREQEEGVNRTAKGKHGEPIPTTFTSGEGEARTRRKRVMRKYYLNRLRVAQGMYAQAKRDAHDESQVLPLLIAMAKKKRKKVIFWQGRRKSGLFLIDDKRLPMLYDLSERTITSKARPWLSEATARVAPRLRKLYGKALFYNLKKYSK